jgi:NAD dependent epimerase/dehydratase family enzyme
MRARRTAQLAFIDLARKGLAYRRPSYFPVPAFAMRLIMGEKATLVLDGQRQIPQRLLQMGFVFQFHHLLKINELISHYSLYSLNKLLVIFF